MLLEAIGSIIVIGRGTISVIIVQEAFFFAGVAWCLRHFTVPRTYLKFTLQLYSVNLLAYIKSYFSMLEAEVVLPVL